jgi:hypothetical protein
MSRSAYIDYTNEKGNYINNYPEANIQFRETVKGFPMIPDSSLEHDARLDALDARMEELYKTDTIMMELTLSEPEDNIRPDFDEEEYDDFEELYDDNYEEYSLSDRFNDDEDDIDKDEYCMECREKKSIGFDLCNDCLYLLSSPVSNEERDETLNLEPVFPAHLCSRDSAIARDSDGEPIPYKNGTNDDLPDVNVLIKTLSLNSLNKQFHVNQALSMEDYEELEKYSHKTQLSLLESVSYSRQCHRCGDDMGEKRYKEIYCCDDCEIAVEVYENDCIYANLRRLLPIHEIDCKICSRKSNFAFNMKYDVALSEIRIQNVRKFAKEHRIKMSDAIPRYAELNDCGKDCDLCYSLNV